MAIAANVLCILALFKGAMSGGIWHVAPGGSDHDTCGQTRSASCRTMAYVITHAVEGGTIYVHNEGHARGTFYEECDNVHINTSLTIVGDGSDVSVGCTTDKPLLEGKVQGIFTIGQNNSSNEHIPIKFKNITFTNGYIFITDSRTTFTSTIFHNVALRSHPSCSGVELSLEHTHMYVSILDDLVIEHLFDTLIMCHNIETDIRDSEFNDINLTFEGRIANHVALINSIFVKRLHLETGMGGVSINLPYENGSVDALNCTFENHIHYDPIKSSINIESSTLRIDSDTRYGNSKTGATINITECVFRNNERAVSISKAFRNISIVRCHFVGNSVMHAAAGIRLAIGDENLVLIKDTLFESNAAGFNRHESIPGKFEYDGFQIRITEKMINGIISLVGKGGAVRIHRGHVVFDGCTFVNNTATLLGGAIYLAKNGTMHLVNCHFENSVSNSHSMQGDVIYSSGMVSIVNNTYNIQTAMDHVSILRHSGNPWSMSVKSLWFECPTGNRLVMINNTSHRVEPQVGLMRSNKLDQLYYYCSTCGNNQYSVDQGFVNYTVTSDSDDFFTLLINGRQPFESHPIEYKYGNITCRECPYGGDCEEKIKSVANFWGYIAKDVITFQHCPPEYCCTSTDCPGIDTCAAHRHGRLCGNCEAGYSEALFSENCIPNINCDSDWVWATLAIMGIVYTIFLITQKDIRDMIGAWGDSMPSLCNKAVQDRPFVLFTKKNIEKPTSNGNDGTALNGNNVVSEYTYTSDKIPESNRNRRVEKNDEADTSDGDKPAGTLIILFYYFQDSLLLHVDTVYTKTVSKFVKRLKSFLVGLFRFRLDVFQFMDDICVFPDLKPVQKLLLKTLFIPYVLLLLGLVFVLHQFVRQMRDLCCRKMDNHRNEEETSEAPVNNDSTICQKADTNTSFSCRLAAGFILAMLFTYQKMATATFTLLNCVPVGNVSVLYVDGTRECFEPWQYGVMIFAFTSVVPFCLVLMMGPPLLKCKSISVCDFCVGCIVPFPTIMYWTYKHIRQCDNGSSTGEVTPEADTIMGVLQGPFKDSKSKSLVGQFCWAGVLVARRLILFLCYTFINDVLVRLLCMLCVCFVILMHHMYIRPYKVQKANLAGALSAAALLIVGTINLLRACFEAAEYIPQGPYKFLMEVCEEIENSLVLWLPLVGVCLILIAFITKMFTLLFGLLQKKTKSDLEYRVSSNSNDDENNTSA